MPLTDQDIRRARILIVADQDADVRLLTQLLAEGGYSNVTTTDHPGAAGALHPQNDHDLILLDLHMPAMDGFEALALLQTDADHRRLPVIVLTAQPEHRLRALREGARDFISRPFDLLEVTTRIGNVLGLQLAYRRLEAQNQLLERRVQERTAELLESETRYRRLTELASDWYWEQDEDGHFTKVYGPVADMLGVEMDDPADMSTGWDEAERAKLRAAIAARKPFLDFAFGRVNADGSRQQFRVSGEPMFTQGCRFAGYRGVGVEVAQPHRTVA